MEHSAFDRLMTLIGQPASRRGGVRAALGALLALGSGQSLVTQSAGARRRHLRTEACIPTGKPCPSKKPRGHNKRGKARTLSCHRCCQRHVATVNGKSVCACQPETMPCTDTTECCLGVCLNGACVASTGCPACSGATPVCRGDTCVACTSSPQCPAHTSCLADGSCGTCGNARACPPDVICRPDGSCQPCDVCLSGACDFTSVQAALDATPPRATITICPGAYAGDDVRFGDGAVSILRSVRLIGAGDGPDPTTNTHLTPATADQKPVSAVAYAGDMDVVLESLRITGGSGTTEGLELSAAGHFMTVGLINCTITNNGSGLAGGVAVGPGVTATFANTHVTTNTGSESGGILALGHVILDELSRVTGNTATNGNGGINSDPGAVIDLPSVDNVTGNTSSGANKNCGGGGTFNGAGGVFCTNN